MKKDYRIQSLPRMFEQVAKQIVQYIHSQELKPGAKLPTERQLSDLLEVSRSSVREGIRVLELLHFLESKQGEGTFVANPPPYLIPHLVIQEKLPPDDSVYYFDTALMCAEKIVLAALRKQFKFREKLPDQPFWAKLDAMIVALGESHGNPFYASLWADTFQLLSDNEYFSDKADPFDWQEFIESFNRGDEEKIRKFLNLLATEL